MGDLDFGTDLPLDLRHKVGRCLVFDSWAGLAAATGGLGGCSVGRRQNTDCGLDLDLPAAQPGGKGLERAGSPVLFGCRER